ncbi:UNVERIFIED_CONTAM: hypothetical protein RMT77_006191 [Armadillidium vulgare]
METKVSNDSPITHQVKSTPPIEEKTQTYENVSDQPTGKFYHHEDRSKEINTKDFPITDQVKGNPPPQAKNKAHKTPAEIKQHPDDLSDETVCCIGCCCSLTACLLESL